MYLNPPTTVCTDDAAEDANQAGSVGYVDEHDANDNAIDEYYTNHKTVAGTRLQQGIACALNSACTTSGLCSAGICRNRLMFCARTEFGSAGGDVDNYDVRDVILHFRIP